MIALYQRVSTEQQNCTVQLTQLQTVYPDASKIVAEVVSGKSPRPKLDELCHTLGKGDTLAVVALDRLGRSMLDVVGRVRSLIERGVSIHSLREGHLNNTPAGQFQITILAAAAEFERSLIVERTLAGVAQARKEGRFSGPPPDTEMRAKVLELHAEGYRQLQIASELGRSLSFVKRAIRGHR